MTTFAPSATKASSTPLHAFTMFPPGGASGMKAFPVAFGASASNNELDDVQQVPIRPMRHHVQHASQWAETKTVAPGLIMRSTTATVSQWSEYSSSSTTVQQTSEVSRSSSTQFQSVRTQSVAASGPLTPAQYLDDLQLPTEQLDLAAQLGKGCIGRKGSLGGRRPPTIRSRRSSHNALTYHQDQVAPPTNGTAVHARSVSDKTPPPRPPPPVFVQQRLQPSPPTHQKSSQHPQDVATSTEWTFSRSATPPSLPANSPPPLPNRDELDFVLENGSVASTASSGVRSPVTDVVEINDKESVEDGEVVRRRTIITLGKRPAGGVGSNGSISVHLLNGADPTPPEDAPKSPGRASAFNARRTIEQRRCQQQQPAPATTPPASTYLYGECGSPASSFGDSSIRTMSISMSFDDLDSSNASCGDVARRPGVSAGRNRSEAWYERRQSYGFEAADKLQSLLNTSGGSSDGPSTGAVSRSCDSLSSTVRSTCSSQLEKMIPPWIKNASPVSNRKPEVDSMDDVLASRASEESDDEVESSSSSEDEMASPVPTATTPTPSLQRSESSRSATTLLEESEPIWLRDLRVRRSLRDGRRKPPAVKSPTPIETPVWLGVKLRPTGLNLVDQDASGQPSPTKPNYTPIFTFTNTSATAKIQQHLRNSRESLLADAVPTRKPASSIVLLNSSRESLNDEKLHHHRSVELMRMLDETPPASARLDGETASVYSVDDGTECSSVRNSVDDLASTTSEIRRAKRVAFGADVKTESDQKRSRPRRIRSRSPESRLREWQVKLEEVKSGSSAETTPLPMKRFGDDADEETTNGISTSDTFRSLLQQRKPYNVQQKPVAVKESVVVDSYPLMRASSAPAEGLARASTIKNGIVNFDASVERKIVILETDTCGPAPKSILKKRSMENLLDVPVAPPAVQSGIKVSITNNNKMDAEPPQVLPWRIHLKHVEPEVESTPEVMPPWRIEMVRRKTPPLVAADSFGRGRSPSVTSETPIPGISAAEIIRNLRPAPTPVMMVARCEVKESTYRQPLEVNGDPPGVDIIDETIAQLNETIEEIRSVDTRNETPTPIQIAVVPDNGVARSSVSPGRSQEPSRFYIRATSPDVTY